MWIHLAIQNSVISFASSTNPMSSNSCVVPRTALSSALNIHACVKLVCSPTVISLVSLERDVCLLVKCTYQIPYASPCESKQEDRVAAVTPEEMPKHRSETRCSPSRFDRKRPSTDPLRPCRGLLSWHAEQEQRAALRSMRRGNGH